MGLDIPQAIELIGRLDDTLSLGAEEHHAVRPQYPRVRLVEDGLDTARRQLDDGRMIGDLGDGALVQTSPAHLCDGGLEPLEDSAPTFLVGPEPELDLEPDRVIPVFEGLPPVFLHPRLKDAISLTPAPQVSQLPENISELVETVIKLLIRVGLVAFPEREQFTHAPLIAHDQEQPPPDGLLMVLFVIFAQAEKVVVGEDLILVPFCHP